MMTDDAIMCTLEENKFRAAFRQDFAGGKILEVPLNCTICDVPMKHQQLTSNNLHPVLGVLVCNHCHELCETVLKSVLYNVPTYFVYCLWCCMQHHTSKAEKFNTNSKKRRLHSKTLETYFWKCKCSRPFCEECIRKHAPETIPMEEEHEWWVCFKCDSQPIWSLRAQVNEVLSCNGVLVQETEKQNETKCCVVCYDKPTQMAFYPCGHLCLCIACSPKYKKDYANCPKCRQKYTDVVRIYQE